MLHWDGANLEAIERWVAEHRINAVLSDSDAPESFDVAEWISLHPGDGVPPRNFSNMAGIGRCALRMMVGQVEQNQRGLPVSYQTILVGPTPPPIEATDLALIAVRQSSLSSLESATTSTAG